MISYARLRPGPGFQPGSSSLYYAQRLATAPTLRRSMSRAIASAIRLRHGAGSWPSVGADYASAASTLREQGISMLPELVGTHAASTILDYFLRKEVVGADGRLVPLERLPLGTAMAAYPLRTVLESADLLNLVNAPPVLRIAADYLGCKPTLSSLGVRWSFPSHEPPRATQQFHRDPDDWHFLKLFVYLTDVDAGSGPHIYVRQSHRTAGRIRAGSYSRAEVEHRYGRENVHSVIGARGTAFMADTYGIHAGMIPTHTPRLMLQAQYSLLPVYAFRYEPLVLQTPSGLDPYVNRLLITKQLPLHRGATPRTKRVSPPRPHPRSAPGPISAGDPCPAPSRARLPEIRGDR